MRLLLFALLAVFQTPQPTPTPLPRLALMMGTALQPVTQPAFDRWTKDVGSRFATRFPVTIVPEPTGTSQASALGGFCKPLGIVGALSAGRLWRMSSAKITMTVEYAIFDCDGDLFYDGISKITQARNLAMIPQAQVESIASHATDAFLANFARFAASHPAQWSRLLATGSMPRFATVVGVARAPITQPRFERFVAEASTRFAAQFSVTAVPLPGTERPQVGNPALCNSLGIVGFAVPEWRWNTTSETVSATARLFIFDCAGDRFFDGSASFSEPRDEAQIPQAQIDSATSRAIGLVLEKFAMFASGNNFLWSRLLASGSIREVQP